MLNLAEEILLIALDDKTGRLVALPTFALDISLAGAILMELILIKKISITGNGLKILERTPTGDSLIDYALDCLPIETEPYYQTEACLQSVAQREGDLVDILARHLVAKKILKKDIENKLWILKTTVYPMIQGEQEKESRQHIRAIILNEETIPNSRDIVLVSLLDSAHLLQEVLTSDELEMHAFRINKIKQMDILGQAVLAAIDQIQTAIARLISLAGM